MLTKSINFTNFKIKKSTKKINKHLSSILSEKNSVIESLSTNYKNSFTKKSLKKFKSFLNFRMIGMGGSTLGSQAIYDFLNHKIKKNFYFIDNLKKKQKKDTKKFVNLIVSKSGNTIETIANTNILIKKNEKNIFITENKNNYLHNLAQKLKAEVIHHNNFIGGRYSVLSEVGMAPAELMGLNPKKFRQLNQLIKNKNFFETLITNVSSTLFFINKKKFNSIIINYDENSENLFKWYQQLIAESLGKKKKGILPIISTMPKDNHSVMQLYLDGFQNNFFTFFYVKEKKSQIINNTNLSLSFKFLKNKKISDIIFAQKKATENVFRKKNIPYRSFEIIKRDEKTLGELFCFFILETILLGRMLNLNPFNQPSVELIKKETLNLLI
ncbi:glucose-6-phosphate isomerase [Candidatus Pelagibacter sp. FZCC0015]|uniref:glucose-6-phosphate isomerase n=1 Tax=Candidatus Pelagibacter sp. FZCC0015 TaxID=2268451 RepID=UPI0011A7B7AB|nr:glucose-6-phosphate isomerase [Candidatus Pelagibacter sp. FZCC0015]